VRRMTLTDRTRPDGLTLSGDSAHRECQALVRAARRRSRVRRAKTTAASPIATTSLRLLHTLCDAPASVMPLLSSLGGALFEAADSWRAGSAALPIVTGRLANTCSGRDADRRLKQPATSLPRTTACS